jgi:hypothetical protein
MTPMNLNPSRRPGAAQLLVLILAVGFQPIRAQQPEPAAVDAEVAELMARENERRAALRAMELPSGAASKHCRIIEGSRSPDGRYAFGYGVLPEGSTSAVKMAPEADGPVQEVTCLVDLKQDRILALGSVSHGGPEETYNHNTHSVVWAPDSTLVIQLEDGKWETLQAEAFRLSAGKAVWLTDVRADLSAAVEMALPDLSGVSTLSFRIAKDGAVSGTCAHVVPRSDEDPKEFRFRGRFASDGSFVSVVKGPGTTGNGEPFANVPAVQWAIDTQEVAGQPQSSVHLVADGKSVPFVRGNNLAVIAKEDWAKHEIPADALLAAGGWWAGGGEYYYVRYEDGVLVAYRAIVEEGSAPEREYFAVRDFVAADFR